jgi:hypothetical protein
MADYMPLLLVNKSTQFASFYFEKCLPQKATARQIVTENLREYVSKDSQKSKFTTNCRNGSTTYIFVFPGLILLSFECLCS